MSQVVQPEVKPEYPIQPPAGQAGQIQPSIVQVPIYDPDPRRRKRRKKRTSRRRRRRRTYDPRISRRTRWGFTMRSIIKGIVSGIAFGAIMDKFIPDDADKEIVAGITIKDVAAMAGAGVYEYFFDKTGYGGGLSGAAGAYVYKKVVKK